MLTSPLQIAFVVIAGVVTGACGAILGTGVIGVTAAASAFLYCGRGEVRPALTAAAVLGVVAGSAFGSALNPKRAASPFTPMRTEDSWERSEPRKTRRRL